MLARQRNPSQMVLTPSAQENAQSSAMQGRRTRRRMGRAMSTQEHFAAWLLWSATRFVVIPSARFRRSAFSSCKSAAALEHKVKAFYQPRPMQTASSIDTGKLQPAHALLVGCFPQPKLPAVASPGSFKRGLLVRVAYRTLMRACLASFRRNSNVY